MPESADFVMYWWHKAAELVRAGEIRQFGFITTNSLRQTFNRRVIEKHMAASPPLSIAFAIPDHPWVDSADGADVRIAMTVGRAGEVEGLLLQVVDERTTDRDELEVRLEERVGFLGADLRCGVDMSRAKRLASNTSLSGRGVSLHGSGFILKPEDAESLGLGHVDGIEKHIRAYRNGRDLMSRPRGVYVIDLFGLESEDVRRRFPAVYQWVVERVKPERDQNNRATYRDNWWIFGEPRREWRRFVDGLPRYIATVETAKHRVFQFLGAEILPDNMLVNIAVDDAHVLGVLSSRLHVAWALAAGGRLGVGNDPRYNKTRCFETFPFPDPRPEQRERIGKLAEEIDALRKRQQAAHEKLTLTDVYNVLEKVRAEQPLSKAEREIHEQGLVSLLRELHDALDAAVFEAYGWEDLGKVLVGRPGATTPLAQKPQDQAEAEEELLRRLVALNAERAAEEARGQIRWLRAEYQAPDAAVSAPAQTEIEGMDDAPEVEAEESKPRAKAKKATWPKAMREQIAAVRAALERGASSPEAIAQGFKRAPVEAIRAVLEALEALGMVRRDGEAYQLAA